MNRTETPPAGWYPDPRFSRSLRWWDGTDWTEEVRARAPSDVTFAPQNVPGALPAAPGSISRHPPPPGSGMGQADVERVIAQVREAARAEVDRAADLFSARARLAGSEFAPLISQYTSNALRWVKILLVIVTIAIVAWFVFQAVAQATFFEWLGDRIDNVSNN